MYVSYEVHPLTIRDLQEDIQEYGKNYPCLVFYKTVKGKQLFMEAPIFAEVAFEYAYLDEDIDDDIKKAMTRSVQMTLIQAHDLFVKQASIFPD